MEMYGDFSAPFFVVWFILPRKPGRVKRLCRFNCGRLHNFPLKAVSKMVGSKASSSAAAPGRVHGDGYVELKRAYYSVPPEYVGRQVWVRWEARLSRVFNQRREVIAVHALAEPGKFSAGLLARPQSHRTSLGGGQNPTPPRSQPMFDRFGRITNPPSRS